MKAYDLTVTGSLNITEQISGSSTSTGSFGRVVVRGDNGLTQIDTNVRVPGGAVANPSYAFSDDTNTGMSRPTSNTINFVSAGSEIARINATGLAIGTTTVSNNLDVEDTIGIKRSGVAATTTLQMTGAGLTINGHSGYHPLIIQGNGTEFARFKSDGKLGIGTDQPQRELDVVGDIRASGDVIADRFIVSSSVSHITMSFSSGSTIFGDGKTDIHQFTGSIITSGSIGINNESPEASLDVNTIVPADGGTTYGAIIRGSEIAGANLGQYDGIGLKFEIPIDTATSNIGASIEAIKASNLDSNSETILKFKTSGNDETLDTALTIAANQNVFIEAAKSLYFDGGGHTYISETSNDVLDVYVGGANALKIAPTEIQIPRYLTHMGDGNNYLDFGTDTLTFVNDGGNTLELGSDHFVRIRQGNLGIGVAANSDFQLQVSGSGIQQMMLHSVDNTSRLNLRGHTQADIVFKDTGGGSDTKTLQQTLGADVFKFRTLTDAGAIGIDPVLEFDLATGNSIFGGNKVSGSATTTGSFGRIQVPQTHFLEFLAGGVGTAHKWQIFNNASNILELSSTAYGGAVFFVDATGGGVNVAANLDVGAGIDVTGDGNFSGNVIVDTGAVYARRAGGTLAGAGSNLGGMENLSLGSQTADKGTRIKMDSGNSTGEFIMQARGSSGYSDGQIEFFRRSASTVFDHLLTISGDGKQISGSQYSTGSFGRIEANVAGIHITTSSMAIDNDLVGGGNLTYGNVTTDRHEFTGSLNVSGSGIEIDGGLGINTPVDAQITTKTKVDGSNAIVALDHDGNTMMRLRDSAGAALFNLYDGGVESITLDADGNGGGLISGSAKSTGSLGRLHLISVNDNALQSKFEALHIVNNINGGNGTGHTGEIVFRAGGGFPGHPAGRIGSITEATYGASGTRDAGLFFSTVDSSANAADVERMRIDASGKIGMGSSDPAANLHVKGDEPEFFIQHSGTSGNDKTKISFGDIHGQVHAQMFTQLKDDTSGGPFHSEFHLQTAASGTSVDRIIIEEQGHVVITGSNKPFVVSGSSKGLLEVLEDAGPAAHIIVGATNMDSKMSFRRSSNGAQTVQVLSMGSSLNVGDTSNNINTFINSNTITLKVGENVVSSSAASTGSFGRLHINSGVLKLDSDSRFSLSNNDTSGTGGGDSTSGNTIIGWRAANTLVGSGNTGYQSVIIGHRAGEDITTGDNNLIIGNQAGKEITTSGANVFLGTHAGGSIAAGQTDTDGTVAIGYFAGNALTSGIKTVAIGYTALQNQTTGNRNTVIGYGAMYTADAGEDFNVVIGSEAGYYINNDASHDNVIIGVNALQGGTGTILGCVAIGTRAMDGVSNNNQTGTIAIGSDALGALTSGGENMAIGYKAMEDMTTGAANIAIGYETMKELNHADADANIALGNGVLSTVAAQALHSCVGIGHNALNDVNNATATGTIGIGRDALSQLTNGEGNTAIGYEAAKTVQGGEHNTIVGYEALEDGDVSHMTMFGYRAGQSINSADAKGSVGIGVRALTSVTSGQANVAIGSGSLSAEDDGDFNTAIGTQALAVQTGVSGVVANTAVGYYAGTSVTTGIKNTMLGAYAGYKSLLVDNTVLLGYNAGGSAAMTSDADGTVAVGWSALANLTSGQRNIAIGYEALDALKVGDDNIALGYQALTNLGTSTFANRNIAIGTYALLSAANNNINDNIAIGYGALSQSVHSDGDNNVAIGTNAMSDLTAGAWGNVAVGQDALRRTNHADSQGSTAVGFGALTANVSGIGNTAIGFDALKSEDDGDYNTAVGYEALEDQTGTTGTVGNTAVGYHAGKGVVTGKFNTFIGGNSGETASGSAVDENAALGYAALGKLNSGSRNTALGTAAGQLFQNASDIVAVGYYTLANANTSTDIDGCVAVGSLSQAENKTGQGNVSVGKSALQTDVNGDNNTAIGHEALKVQNGVSGNVGNTAVGNSALHDHTSGQQNTVIGAFAMSTNLTGRYNTVVGYEAFAAANGAEDNHVIIGRSAGYNLDGAQNCVMVGRSTQGSSATATNQNVFGYHAAGQVDNSVTLGNGDVTRVYMSEDGDAEMYANGTINTSDRRLKENIDDSDLGLEFVNKLRPVSYKFKKDKQSNKLKYGIIAQEVQEVLKETNNEDFAGITDKGDYLGADYVQFIAPLIKSVQELTEMVKSQQKEIEELKINKDKLC